MPKDFLEQNGLHAATSKGYEKIIQMIYDHYVKNNDTESINLTDNLGMTAYDLAMAKETKNEAVINLLSK